MLHGSVLYTVQNDECSGSAGQVNGVVAQFYRDTVAQLNVVAHFYGMWWLCWNGIWCGGSVLLGYGGSVYGMWDVVVPLEWYVEWWWLSSIGIRWLSIRNVGCGGSVGMVYGVVAQFYWGMVAQFMECGMWWLCWNGIWCGDSDLWLSSVAQLCGSVYGMWDVVTLLEWYMVWWCKTKPEYRVTHCLGC
jgi:hypothetical protein